MHCHIPRRGSHHRPEKNTIREILAGVFNVIQTNFNVSNRNLRPIQTNIHYITEIPPVGTFKFV